MRNYYKQHSCYKTSGDYRERRPLGCRPDFQSMWGPNYRASWQKEPERLLKIA